MGMLLNQSGLETSTNGAAGGYGFHAHAGVCHYGASLMHDDWIAIDFGNAGLVLRQRADAQDHVFESSDVAWRRTAISGQEREAAQLMELARGIGSG